MFTSWIFREVVAKLLICNRHLVGPGSVASFWIAQYVHFYLYLNFMLLFLPIGILTVWVCYHCTFLLCFALLSFQLFGQLKVQLLGPGVQDGNMAINKFLSQSSERKYSLLLFVMGQNWWSSIGSRLCKQRAKKWPERPISGSWDLFYPDSTFSNVSLIFPMLLNYSLRIHNWGELHSWLQQSVCS